MSNKLKSKVYAVRAGYNIGIYHSWKECEEQVKGYSGAEFKSFNSMQDALDYMHGTSFLTDHEMTNVFTKPDEEQPTALPGSAICYTDGSYDDKTKRFSYGLVLFVHGEPVHEEAQAFDYPEFVSSRNVAGEILGAVRAIDLCLEKGIHELHLYYDYSGIAMWATHEWKAKSEIAKYYQNQVYEAEVNGLKIVFHKVKGHTGVTYNERADKLAASVLF